MLELAELSRNMENTYEQILPFVPAGVEGVEDSTVHGNKEGADTDLREDMPTEEDALMEGKSLKSIEDSMQTRDIANASVVGLVS